MEFDAHSEEVFTSPGWLSSCALVHVGVVLLSFIISPLFTRDLRFRSSAYPYFTGLPSSRYESFTSVRCTWSVSEDSLPFVSGSPEGGACLFRRLHCPWAFFDPFGRVSFVLWFVVRSVVLVHLRELRASFQAVLPFLLYGTPDSGSSFFSVPSP